MWVFMYISYCIIALKPTKPLTEEYNSVQVTYILLLSQNGTECIAVFWSIKNDTMLRKSIDFWLQFQTLPT